uniref:Coiled-coil-helix-coiled-coil-helix domain containing 6a n=1 Tax=Scophthalmus maximus TaxID=52904 RepID=A0A8D2ZZ80_SCOMX
MGSGESTTRRVSFGVDDEDRVRILRGVKLSEDVLQRMRGVANIAPERTQSTTSSAQKDTGAPRSANPSSGPQQSSQPRAQPGSWSSTSTPDSNAKEEQRRFEQKQTKEDPAKGAQREREVAMKERTKALSRERQHTRQEAEKAQQLARQLQKKDLQLKALDAFYKEQLAQLEKRNLERYEESKEQFHQAASKTEGNVRPQQLLWSRNIDPVCLGLQARILSCYREKGDQTLKCSDLAKEYMQCINAAKKNLLINRG